MKAVLFLFISLLTITIYAGNENTQQKLNGVNKNFFIENKGQWPSEVKYLAKIGGMNAWITNSGVVYDYYQVHRNYTQQQLEKLTPDKKTKFEQDNTSIKGHVVKMQLVDVNVNAASTADNRQEGYYNYFLGNDQTKWASNVPLYGNVVINEIYPNIDVKYYFDGKNIRYDYIVKPGADISKLKMKFEGQESVRINESGELVIKTSLGEVTNGKLYSYQNNNGKQQEIACNFIKNQDGNISLNVNSYDKTKDLIIDPLVYSTFIGGTGGDEGRSIRTNTDGNAFITGSAGSQNFPTTPGAYQTTIGGGFADVFITKLNQTGSSIIFSTFVGGSQQEVGYSIALDISGNTYTTGWTSSLNFPTTSGAFQPTFGGASFDGFIIKLNPTGSALIYSTFIGGNYVDYGTSISADANGNAFVTGNTRSSNFPITPGAFQTTLSGMWDVFVAKLNPTGSALIYSTFIGGNRDDYPYSIAIDANGNAYITGYTGSPDYPITPGAFQTTLSGYIDAFVAKLNPTGSALIYCTFIGGTPSEATGTSISIDANCNAYITGYTYSPDYPTTPGAYQTTFSYSDYNYNAFITKLNAAGNALVYSTFIGVGKSNSIAVDAYGNAYVTGNTSSPDYPTTPGAFQTTKSVISDAFVTKLNPTGSALIYSSYIGGNSYDFGNAIAIDVQDNAYITGQTDSPTYPTTPGAFQTTGGSWDAFVTKLNMPYLPYLQLKSPNGGEGWAVNSSYKITWRSNSNILSNNKIEYSTDSGETWMTIVSSVPSLPYEYSWTIPNTLSTHCKVRITALDSSGLADISDSSFTISLIESINENNLVPLSNSLNQNFPNPFNPQTTISYSVAQESNVVIRVFDILGKEVAKLLNEGKKAGVYNIQFNASKLSSGMYFYTIQANSVDGKQSFRETKKMLLLK